MRSIGKGHAAASKVCSFLGLKPINKQYWSDTSKKIYEETKEVLEKNLNEVALKLKRLKRQSGEINCAENDLKDVVVDAGVSLDGSWNSRGWSATDCVVAAISIDTGEVVDVVHMNSHCPECKTIAQKKAEGKLSRMEYLSWFVNHESSCCLNHEGSSAVGRKLSDGKGLSGVGRLTLARHNDTMTMTQCKTSMEGHYGIMVMLKPCPKLQKLS
ncbi:hypothetical protein QZH41_016312 [Actinostola sp. cb2023]|nr:hypothetical protein QZH41_016312 [Actinostola sp. cb2023]